MDLNWLITPVLGGVIGYSTNYLAIKMLFRPYQPKFIGKFQIPFTPGIIPKERKRIAQALGEVIEKHLMTPEVIKKEIAQSGMEHQLVDAMHRFLLSDAHQLNLSHSLNVLGLNSQETIGSIAKWIVNRMRTMDTAFTATTLQKWMESNNNDSTWQMLFKDINPRLWIDDQVVQGLDQIIGIHQEQITQVLIDGLESPQTRGAIISAIQAAILEKLGALGAMFVDVNGLYDAFIKKMNEEKVTMAPIVGNYGSSIIRQFLLENKQPTDEASKEILKSTLIYIVQEQGAELINQCLRNLQNEDALIEQMEKGIAHLLAQSITIDEQTLKQIDQVMVQTYQLAIDLYMPNIVASLSVSKMVENQLNGFDTAFFENILLAVINKELVAITNLGGVLGFIIGCITLFI